MKFLFSVRCHYSTVLVKVNFITSNTFLLNLIVPIIFKSFVESVLFALETAFRRKSVKQAYLFY